MKKILTINLVNGSKIERDLTLEGSLPLGAPANSEYFAGLCATVASNGYTDIDSVTDKHYRHIAPSQIESVEITFK
jgi:hypothetical protein